MTEASAPTEEALPDGVTYDYTRRLWGHDYTITKVIDGGQELYTSGWGPDEARLQRGDYLLLQVSKPGGSTRYQVAEVRYHWDPSDMWTATLRFAPRGSA